MASRDEVLVEFLDRMYRDILAIEEEYGMQASARDLRPPVEAYHDAIRIWQAGDERLPVEDASWAIHSIRQRANWMRSGPQAFWQDKDRHHKQTLEKAREFKRWCIRHVRQLQVPMDVVQEDLVTFAHWVKGSAEERLARELALREAQKYRGRGTQGYWEAVEADEFWQGFAYTAAFFKDMRKQLAGPNKKILIEDHSAETGGVKRFAKQDWRTSGEEALRGLWVQIMHPLSLKAAFIEKQDKRAQPKLMFDEARYVPEIEWQRMKVNCLRLADAYEHYAVLYAAALAPEVDKSYKEQKALLDTVVSDSYALLKLIERLEKGDEKLEIYQLERLVKEVDNPEMKARLAAVLAAQRVDRISSSGGLKGALNGVMQQAEQELDALEKAHFQFLSSQLSIYEDSKTVVKQLATQGLNLAGKFVATAAAIAAGRGKGGPGR